MKYKKQITWIFLFFLALALVNAQPPFQESETQNSDLTIIGSALNYFEYNKNIDVHFHVYNLTDFIDNTTAMCFLHTYNQSNHIEKLNLTYEQPDFETMLNKSKYPKGSYSLVAFCNTSNQVGFLRYGFQIVDFNEEGIPKINFNGQYPSAPLAILLFMIFIITGLFYLSKVNNLTKNIVTDFILKRSFLVIGMYLILYTSTMLLTFIDNAGIPLNNEFIRLMWIIGTAGRILTIWLLLGTIIKTTQLWRMQVEDKRMGEHEEDDD